MKRLTQRTFSYRLPAVLLVAAVGATSALADYPGMIQGFAPLDYWRFNETTGSPAINFVANLGSAGVGATGYIRAGAATGEPGIVGNSVRIFNTAETVGLSGSSVDIAPTPALNPAPPFTVEFWTKPNSLSSDSTGMCALSSMSPMPGGGSRSGYLFYINQGGITLRLGGEAGYAATAAANFAIAANQWIHVVGEFDGTTARIFINGAFKASGAANAAFKPNLWTVTRFGGTSLNGTATLNGGGILTDGNRCYDGWLDEVAVYNSLLSSNTIATHYSTATSNPSGYDALVLASSPVGYWNCDEAAYTTPPSSTFPTAADLGSAGDIGTNTLGTLAGQAGVPYTGFGSGNQCVFYDGVSGSTVLTNVNAIPNIVGHAFTLMAWVKAGSTGYVRNIIEQGLDANFAETFLREDLTYDWIGYGSPDVYYYEFGSYNGAQALSAAIYPVPAGDIGNWVFLVGTYDGANWNLYRNGVLMDSEPDGTGGPVSVSAPWGIGARGNPDVFNGFYFNGYIDEPAILNTALDANTVSSLYNAVQIPPVITRAPVPQSGPLYLGGSISFSVWADGSPTLGYSWLLNNSPLGQTGTNLTLSGLTAANTGTYAIKVTNPYGTVTVPVVVTVTPTLPPVTIASGSETRWNGTAYNFYSSSVGSGAVDYHWFHGATELGINASNITGIASVATAGAYTLIISNSFGTATSAPVSLNLLTAPNNYVAAVLADSPIAYYRFDETSGSVAHDFAGGHNGTIFGETLGVPGYSVIDTNTAFSFPGSVGAYVGSIDGSTATGVDFGGPNQEFSVELWANGGSGQIDGAGLIAKGTGTVGGSTATEQFAIQVNGSAYSFLVRQTNAAAQTAISQTGADGGWHHIVGVYDSAGGQTSIYVDGVEEGSAGTLAGLRQSSSGISIGGERSGVLPTYDWVYSGSIDEVAIYHKALTADEVAAHYAAAYGSGLAPFFSVEPVSLTNYQGLPVTFQADAAGTVPITYDWRFNGSSLGVNSSRLNIPSVSSANVGTYVLHISNPVLPAGTDSVAVTLTVLPPPTTAPAVSGLVLHLPLSGNFTDTSGRGHNATPHGSVVWDPNGALGGTAYEYETDTNGGPTNYAVIGAPADLEFSTNINFTVAFWYKMPSANFGSHPFNDLPIFSDAPTSLGGIGLDIAPSFGETVGTTLGWPGAWAYTLYDAAGNGVRVYGDQSTLNDDAWHHWAMVFDRRRGHGEVTYIDGVSGGGPNTPSHPDNQAGTSIADVGDLNSTNVFVIGQDPTGAYAENGTGSINDLGVWRKALSPLEVASLYSAGITHNLSFVGVPFTFSYAKTGSALTLTFSEGMLQSATSVAGPYTDVTDQSPYVVQPNGAAKFFRVHF